MSNILSILSNTLGESKQYSNSEYYFYCPFCHHHKNKLAININNKKWHCWKCNAKGNTILSLLYKLDIDKSVIKSIQGELENEFQLFYKEQPEIDAIKLQLPEEFQPVTDNTSLGRTAKGYLYRRGVSENDIIRYNVGYCETGQYRGRLIIPSYDKFDSLNFFVARDFLNLSSFPYVLPKVKKQSVIMFESMINWKIPIIICEGVFDAMNIRRNAIPLLGTLMSKTLKSRIVKEGVSEVYIMLDTDAPDAAVDISRWCSKCNIKNYIVKYNGKDPGSNKFQDNIKYIINTEEMSFARLLRNKIFK